MAQYKTGTVAVTNGSAVITGTGTEWLANVNAGDGFAVVGDGVVYDVASVDSDTQITLSTVYSGTTASGKRYAIQRDFTSGGIPEMAQGDIETATIFTRAMRTIQTLFNREVVTSNGVTSINTLTQAEYDALTPEDDVLYVITD